MYIVFNEPCLLTVYSESHHVVLLHQLNALICDCVHVKAVDLCCLLQPINAWHLFQSRKIFAYPQNTLLSLFVTTNRWSDKNCFLFYLHLGSSLSWREEKNSQKFQKCANKMTSSEHFQNSCLNSEMLLYESLWKHTVCQECTIWQYKIEPQSDPMFLYWFGKIVPSSTCHRPLLLFNYTKILCLLSHKLSINSLEWTLQPIPWSASLWGQWNELFCFPSLITYDTQ